MQEMLLFAKDELPDNGVKVVDLGAFEVGVFRRADKYFAYRNVCPHQGGPVCEGMRVPKVDVVIDEAGHFRKHAFDLDEMHFVCPWHGWEFKVETGEAVGDSSIRVQRFPIIERDGNLYVQA
jgi:nitrite reductase/ring-hydroxylating ferredoxin subunit